MCLGASYKQHMEVPPEHMLRTRHTAVYCKLPLNIVQDRDLLCGMPYDPTIYRVEGSEECWGHTCPYRD